MVVREAISRNTDMGERPCRSMMSWELITPCTLLWLLTTR